MVPFTMNNFAKYNPFSQDSTYFTPALKGSQSYEMIVTQFRKHLDNINSVETEMKKRLYDPLSQIILINAVKQLNMIKTVFETEGLLGWTDDFNSFCG